MRSRRSRLTGLALAGLLVLTACDDDDDGGESTGTVNLMSAGEPEEVEAYQAIFDELINSEVDYNVEIESVGSLEEQMQIRAEGGTLDVAAVPQPGAIRALVESGAIVALEDLGFDIEELNATLGE